MSKAPDWTLELPSEWKPAAWSEVSIRPLCEVPTVAAMAVQAMLKDGTNIMALMWPGGQRLLRMGPDTAFAMQEHFTGAIPVEHRKVLTDVWSKLVQCSVQAAADADEDLRRMGRVPVRTPRKGSRCR